MTYSSKNCVYSSSIPFIVSTLVVFFALSCFVYMLRNKHIRPVLKEGWSPLFITMMIKSRTGVVLDMFVNQYEGFVLLAVVISSSSFSSLFLPFIYFSVWFARRGRLDFYFLLIYHTLCSCTMTLDQHSSVRMIFLHVTHMISKASYI